MRFLPAGLNKQLTVRENLGQVAASQKTRGVKFLRVRSDLPQISFVLKVSETWLALLGKVKMTSGLDRDPYELNSYIGQIVSVSGLTGLRHIGRLIALDPVSSR